ncbi:TIMELESS-interacting protein-like isoform X1 [Clavelina lepadiformis]|uniref:TIMELESS-interacting protein-like isoform X1 n=1 Tax=Clavelina lepadiformis TaxID=159417 RepID=UPI0040420E1B
MDEDIFADGDNAEIQQRLQAPPIPGEAENGALQEEDAALAELEDVPMASSKKRKSINRGPKLDAKRLLGLRGLPDIPKYFEDVQLQGKGHEIEDLNLILTKLEHWAHRLYPKLTFEDCLEKIEALGHKKEIQTCLKKIHMGMPIIDGEAQSTVITADGPAMLGSEDDGDQDIREHYDTLQFNEEFSSGFNPGMENRLPD